MRRLLGTLDNRGYTFIESLFQLLIMAMFVQFLLLFFLWKAPIERQYSNLAATDWELFAIDLQELLSDVHHIEAHNDNRGIRLVNNRGIIDIEQGIAVIRKRTYGTGHVPLLTNIQLALFSLEGVTLHVHITTLDGTQRERGFAIGMYPE